MCGPDYLTLLKIKISIRPEKIFHKNPTRSFTGEPWLLKHFLTDPGSQQKKTATGLFLAKFLLNETYIFLQLTIWKRFLEILFAVCT